MRTTTGSKLRNLVLAGALAAVSAGALSAPALARDWDHRGGDGWSQDRDWRHDRDDRYWVAPRYYNPYAYYSYGYGYSYAVPAPAPIYVAPPSVDFVFPIHIR
jgi:hypothetical protein